MQDIYKIMGGSGGRCSCGHSQRKGKCYYLVDTTSRAYTMCEHCGQVQGLDKWWGAKKEVTVEEMQAHWFGAEPVKEVVCRVLRKYTPKLRSNSNREHLLEIAVEV